MITYLSQLFQKFANTQKSELSIRRIERVIALTEMNDRMKADYTQRAQKVFFLSLLKIIIFIHY